jgi:DeoR family transcriptional regulator, fructose operon transcriptional repressor
MGTAEPTSPTERRMVLVRMARERGRLEAADAAREVGISLETLRRDLRILEQEGLVRRTHGAFMPTEIGRFENPLHRRESTNTAEKKAIAEHGARLIGMASTVFLDEGIVPNFLIRHLPVDRVLTVVTTSLPTALEISETTHHEILLAGGRVRRTTHGVVGPWSTAALADVYVDVAFIGTNGVSLTHGLTTPDPEVAATKAAALKHSRFSALLCEHVKFGVTSFARFGGVEDLDCIVSGRELSPAMATRYGRLGPKVVRV